MDDTLSTLSVAVEESNPPRVRISGEAGYHNKGQIYDAVRALIDDGHATVRADLSELFYIDSSALATLVKCATEARAAGGVVELTGASKHVSRVLTQCGAASFFKSSVPEVPVDGNLDNDASWVDYWRVSDFTLPATPAAASTARQRVAEVIRDLPLSSKDSADVIIALGEAVANAIRHGCHGDPSLTISVKCVAGPGRLAIDVSDPGPGFRPAEVPVPSPKSIVDGGMGIHIMRELMDEIDFFFDDGTTARLVKYVQPDES